MALYAEQGFDDTTVAEIADRAGVTARTFFRHFADKREVLFAGSEELERRMVDALAAAPPSAGPMDAIAAALRSVAELFADRRDYSRRRQAVIAATPRAVLQADHRATSFCHQAPFAWRNSACVPTGMDSCLTDPQPPTGPDDPDAPDTCADHRRDGGFAVRLALAGVKTIGTKVAETIVTQRRLHGPYASMADLVRRTGLTTPPLEALATAGVFDCFGLDRRQALWEAGRAAEERPERFAGVSVVGPPPTLPGMSDDELTMADLWSTGSPPASTRSTTSANGSPPRGSCPRRNSVQRRLILGCVPRVWSPIGNDQRPPPVSRSLTSKTKPG